MITFYRSGDHSEEARFVAREIVRCAEKSTHEQPYGQIAILYRLNALSRNLESALREQGIPYRIFGGTRFYDRKEIRDVLAYLRLILIPEDRLSFARIINTPRRGIGDATVAAVDAISAQPVWHRLRFVPSPTATLSLRGRVADCCCFLR